MFPPRKTVKNPEDNQDWVRGRYTVADPREPNWNRGRTPKAGAVPEGAEIPRT